MEVFIERENKKIDVKFSGKAEKLLKKLKINKETVLIVKDNTLVQTDEKLSNKDKIKLISVVSGG